MIRISDILKKIKEKEKNEKEEKEEKEEKKKPLTKSPPPETAAHEPAPPPPPQETAPSSSPIVVEKLKPQEEAKKEEPSSSEISIYSIMMKESKIASKEESAQIYDEALSLIKEIISKNANYELIEVNSITGSIGKIVNQLRLNNPTMLELALTRNCLAPYIFCHSINVCIISLILGLELGYATPKLMDLGVSAFLHDVGMVDYLSLVNEPRKLNAKEYNLVKNHPLASAKILEKIKGLNEIPAIVAEQHHERLDGSGYPKGLKDVDIHEYAKIVSVVDIYEAMMHSRAYRMECPALETIQEIIAHKGAYEYKYVKKLINKVGIFSIGQLVALNTKEVALVVKLNPHNILRPMVEIIYDSTGEKLSERKKIDLASEPNIWIIKGTKDTFRE